MQRENMETTPRKTGRRTGNLLAARRPQQNQKSEISNSKETETKRGMQELKTADEQPKTHTVRTAK